MVHTAQPGRADEDQWIALLSDIIQRGYVLRHGDLDAADAFQQHMLIVRSQFASCITYNVRINRFAFQSGRQVR